MSVPDTRLFVASSCHAGHPGGGPLLEVFDPWTGALIATATMADRARAEEAACAADARGRRGHPPRRDGAVAGLLRRVEIEEMTERKTLVFHAD